VKIIKEVRYQPLVCHPQASKSTFAVPQPSKLAQQSFFQIPQEDLTSLIF
jgi:hypothetical protein